MIRWLGFAAGVALLLVTASSVIKTLLIPRSARSTLNSALGWLNRWVFGKITARVEDLRQRERILAAGGPAWLIALLVSWLACLLLGYALLLWPLNHHTFPLALEEAGSSLFTLGFVRPYGAGPVAVVFLAGASGLALVALLIAYLPTLYTAFNRREISVTTLEALAGSPPWGPELLARQALIGDVAYLPKVYERWTEWAADIAESHTNYRTLAYFRSPDPQTSWLLGLLAVLDAAALHLALNPGTAPPEARPLLRVGYITMRKLARNLGMPVTEDPHPDDPLVLTKAEFDSAIERMRRAGWVFEREPDEAWPHFHGWRVNYEAAAYALARFLDLPPAVWSGSRPRHRPPPQLPVRPPHREPDQPMDPQPRAKEDSGGGPQGGGPQASGGVRGVVPPADPGGFLVRLPPRASTSGAAGLRVHDRPDRVHVRRGGVPVQVRHRGVERDRVARAKLERVETDAGVQGAAGDQAVLAAVMAQRAPRVGGVPAGLVDHFEEVHPFVGTRGQALPAHAAGQVDGAPGAAPLDDAVAAGHRGLPVGLLTHVAVAVRGHGQAIGGRCGAEQEVQRRAQLGSQRVQHAHRRGGQPPLDLRDEAGRALGPAGEFAHG
jgi:hypothetical protein